MTSETVFAKRMGEKVAAGFTAIVATMVIEEVIIVICVKIASFTQHTFLPMKIRA